MKLDMTEEWCRDAPFTETRDAMTMKLGMTEEWCRDSPFTETRDAMTIKLELHDFHTEPFILINGYA